MNANDRYDSLIRFHAEQKSLDPRIIKRQIRCESAFDPDAVSPVGAKGLMQFMPTSWAWAHDYKNIPDIYNPEASIKAGCWFMSHLLIEFKGELSKALAAYNWGSGHVHKLNGDSGWLTKCPKETQNYVIKCVEYEVESVA